MRTIKRMRCRRSREGGGGTSRDGTARLTLSAPVRMDGEDEDAFGDGVRDVSEDSKSVVHLDGALSQYHRTRPPLQQDQTEAT